MPPATGFPVHIYLPIAYCDIRQPGERYKIFYLEFLDQLN